jgi:branched-chain amino acid transport system permease protein
VALVPIIYNALIIGIFIGSIYGLIAVGLSLVYGVMRVVNISHGEFVMLGAFLTFFAWTLLGINPVICIVIALVVLFFLGLLVHRSLVERVIGKPMLSSLMLTFGVSILIWNTAQAVFTANIKAVSYLGGSVPFLGVNIAKSYILGFGIAVLLVVALFAFLKFPNGERPSGPHLKTTKWPWSAASIRKRFAPWPLPWGPPSREALDRWSP